MFVEGAAKLKDGLGERPARFFADHGIDVSQSLVRLIGGPCGRKSSRSGCIFSVSAFTFLERCFHLRAIFLQSCRALPASVAARVGAILGTEQIV